MQRIHVIIQRSEFKIAEPSRQSPHDTRIETGSIERVNTVIRYYYLSALLNSTARLEASDTGHRYNPVQKGGKLGSREWRKIGRRCCYCGCSKRYIESMDGDRSKKDKGTRRDCRREAEGDQ